MSFQELRIHYHHGNFSLLCQWMKFSLELHPSDTLPLTHSCFLLLIPHIAMHLVCQEFLLDTSTSTSPKSVVSTNLPTLNILLSVFHAVFGLCQHSSLLRFRFLTVKLSLILCCTNCKYLKHEDEKYFCVFSMRMKGTSVYFEAKLLIAAQSLNITVAVESAQKR